MEILYTFDKHNYTDDMPVFERFAVRGIIIRDGRIAMQQAGEGYYKILGGGIDAGETNEEALIREVREESGLVVIPQSIRECGKIIEKLQDELVFNEEKEEVISKLMAPKIEFNTYDYALDNIFRDVQPIDIMEQYGDPITGQ